MSDGTSLAVRPETTLPASVTPPAQTSIQDDGGLGQQHTPAAVQSDDPDAIALAKARAEVAAEEAAAKAEQQGQPKQAGKQSQQRQQQPGAGKGAAPTVPVQRFNELAREARELRDQVAYWKGAAEARKEMAAQQPAQPQGSADQQGSQQPTTAQPIEQQIEAQQAAIAEAADKFDSGEITMRQFVQVQQTADGVIAALRAQALQAMGQAPTTPQPQPTSLADKQILDRHQALLEQRFPWTRLLTVPDLQFLAGIAAQEAMALGQPFGETAQDTLKLRERVAQLSDTFGPTWYPNRVAEVNALRQQAQQAGTAQPSTTQPAAQQPARQEAPPPGVGKLAIADSHPPNINQAGASDDGSGISEARLNTMTTDEIAALPASVRSRFK